MAEIKAITLPSGDSYDIVDQGARDLIANLPSPMVFKGTIGDSKPTASYIWSELPAASGAQGFTYKVISNHSTTPICKNGDTIVSNGVEWVVIPSGDEPSGTVTSVGAGTGLTGGTITDSGTIAVDFTSVQEKLPTGQNDTYLHLNETTGAIEWSEVQSDIPNNIVLASSTTISPREIGDTFSGHGFNEFALKDDLPHIVNSLTSTSTADALAANQGKVLDETIATVQNRLQTQIDAITSQFYTKSETDNLLSGKQTSITASGMLKGDGAGSVSAAIASFGGALLTTKQAKSKKMICALGMSLAYALMLLLGNLLFVESSPAGALRVVLPVGVAGILALLIGNRKQTKHSTRRK